MSFFISKQLETTFSASLIEMHLVAPKHPYFRLFGCGDKMWGKMELLLTVSWWRVSAPSVSHSWSLPSFLKLFLPLWFFFLFFLSFFPFLYHSLFLLLSIYFLFSFIFFFLFLSLFLISLSLSDSFFFLYYLLFSSLFISVTVFFSFFRAIVHFLPSFHLSILFLSFSPASQLSAYMSSQITVELDYCQLAEWYRISRAKITKGKKTAQEMF